MAINVHATLGPGGPATAIELDDAQVDALGGGKRAAVKVTIGDRTAQLRLGVMGGRNLIGLSKASREALGVEIGDTVDAVIELDADPREIEVPDDFAAALAEVPGAREAFDRLAPSHRKEHVRSIERSPVGFKERAACYLYMGYWMVKNRRRLGRNLLLRDA